MSFSASIIRNIVYPLSLWKAGDLARLRYLREFERTQFLTLGELRHLQWQRLRALLVHAYRNCPFYRERLGRAGLVPGDFRSLADLPALPVLEKRDIQDQRDRMVARNWPKHDLIPNQTGGSTGTPISFFLSKDRLNSRAAATIRHNRWSGWDVGETKAVIWGAPQDLPTGRWRWRLRNMLLEREHCLDTGHLTEDGMIAFHHRLYRLRPKIILAYAQAIALFAQFLLARGLKPYRPQAIVTSAEVLEPEARKRIEDVFGCRVFNRYGCREVSVIASECERHQGLHTMAESLYIEIIKDGQPAQPGELGDIVVTDLLNHAMPLVRYRIGDLGAWEEGTCPCGRSLPRLSTVRGRVTDFLVGDDGRLVSGVFLATYLIAQRPSLGQVQIHQETAGQVRFRIKPGRAFHAPDDLDYLERTARKYLGDTAAISWEFVEELRPLPSGKFQFCKSTAALDYWQSSVKKDAA